MLQAWAWAFGLRHFLLYVAFEHGLEDMVKLVNGCAFDVDASSHSNECCLWTLYVYGTLVRAMWTKSEACWARFAQSTAGAD